MRQSERESEGESENDINVLFEGPPTVEALLTSDLGPKGPKR